MRCKQIGLGCVLLTLAAFSAAAIQLPDFFADSDGPFNPPAEAGDYYVDLGLATPIEAPDTWQTVAGNGNGVYDPAQWAVIFRFTEVNIPAHTNVRFKNNHACAPVIWLVQGNVTINGGDNPGQIILSGNNSAGQKFSLPGPGGFRGGRGRVSGNNASAGLGPGGGEPNQGASFTTGTVVYSDEGCFPLIGGSGGGGYDKDVYNIYGGGAGGGAILIVAGGTISIDGSISANGGSGYPYGDKPTSGGSGGMIRLVADTVTGGGGLYAQGGEDSSPGRIRIEAKNYEFAGGTDPLRSFAVAEDVPRLFRDDTTPRLTPTLLRRTEDPENPQMIPFDPRASLGGVADVQLPEEGIAELVVESENVPPTSTVVARMVRNSGEAVSVSPSESEPSVKEVPLRLVKTDGAKSTWSVELDLKYGYSALQVHAIFPEPES